MRLLSAALGALAAAACAQDYFLNCGSATDVRFVLAPANTSPRVASRAPISGATSQYLYQNHRTTRGVATSFTYRFPRRRPGTYLVELAFAEIATPTNTARCARGARRFNADVQGVRVLTNFDVFAKAGCRRATRERTTTTVGRNGRLEFRFSRGAAGRPMISYIKAVYQGPVVAACRGAGAIRRPAVNDMSNAQWNNYVTAITRMRGRTAPGTNLSWYDWFARVHARQALHNQAAFLPWHRVMLFYWDLQLHAGVAGVRQPYFDWSRSATAVFSNPATRAARFGASFNGISLAGPARHTLTRDPDRSVVLRTRQFLNTLVRSAGVFRRFSISLEAAHNSFHNTVGGDMATDYSPNDPYFYAHHAFIDKLYQDWIARSGSTEVPGIGGNRMSPWSETVSQAMTGEITSCVTYVGQSSARQLSGAEAVVDSDAEVKSTADSRKAARDFGASDAQLHLLDEIDAEIMALMGVGNTTTTEPPATNAQQTTAEEAAVENIVSAVTTAAGAEIAALAETTAVAEAVAVVEATAKTEVTTSATVAVPVPVTLAVAETEPAVADVVTTVAAALAAATEAVAATVNVTISA